MNFRKALVCVFAVMVLLAGTSSARADSPASTVVKNFYAQLTNTMKQGEELGFNGRYKQLAPAIKNSYNMPLMARFATGTTWASTSKEDQDRVIDAFTAFSVATYASRFKKYDGEKFEVVSEKPASGGGVIVETFLVPSDGERVALNYLVRLDEVGKPRIVDVLLDATISELATRRAEFSAVIKRDGINALIAMLNDKAKKMELAPQ